MKRLGRVVMMIGLAVFGVLIVGNCQAEELSQDVTLDSISYEYVEKLDGLGYLADMRIGAKPYSRSRMLHWLRRIEDEMACREEVPPYARAMVCHLRRGLAEPAAGVGQERFTIREAKLQTVWTDSEILRQFGTASGYQPLNINHGGRDYSRGVTGEFGVTVEGRLNPDLVLKLSPRFTFGEEGGVFSFDSIYAKGRIGNIELFFGRESAWWGQGVRGSLSLTNQSEPLTAVKMTVINDLQPKGFLKLLGKVRPTAFYSILDQRRGDVAYPSLVGIRTDFIPSESFTFGLGFLSMVGGRGHMLEGKDYKGWLLGTNAHSDDKWNTIAGGDFRWRLPGRSGIQLYGELYGEDQVQQGFIPLPSATAWIGGLFLPRLDRDGKWDLRFEHGQTTDAWYRHWTYKEGYTHRGHLLGDAAGSDSRRFFLQLTNYHDDASRLSFNVEHLKQKGVPAARTINSFWLAFRKHLGDGCSLDASAGMARIGNPDFKNGKSLVDYHLSVGINQTL